MKTDLAVLKALAAKYDADSAISGRLKLERDIDAVIGRQLHAAIAEIEQARELAKYVKEMAEFLNQ